MTVKLNKRQGQLLLILLIAAIAVSAVVFLIPFRKSGVFWVAYIFELIAFALQIPVFKLAFDNADTLRSKFLGFPVFRVGYLYLAIQTVISIALCILGCLEWFPVWAAVAICILVLGCAVACSLTADIAHEAAERIEVRQTMTTSRIETLRTLSAGLSNMTEDTALRKVLSDLADDFRFSDPVSGAATADIEQELENSLRELSGKLSGGNATLEEVQKLQKLLEQRNALCKAGKK